LDALQPRSFDDSEGSAREIGPVGFEFLFEREEASEINKLTVKDMRDQAQASGKIQ